MSPLQLNLRLSSVEKLLFRMHCEDFAIIDRIVNETTGTELLQKPEPIVEVRISTLPAFKPAAALPPEVMTLAFVEKRTVPVESISTFPPATLT